jgi:undecaprenyl diphosphate synthase
MSADLSDPPVPQHIAIIMDGNGRWAQQRGLARLEGHRAGAETVRRIVTACGKLGIKYLTLYAFSTENWNRPKLEVNALMELLRSFIGKRLPELQKHDIRLNAIGSLERLPERVRSTLISAMEATKDNQTATLTLALSYGGRAEITATVQKLAREVQAGRLEPDEITEELIASHLYTHDMPDPELIIRTSGEFRLSNFLLWQASYAEFWQTPTLWPDFSQADLQEAIAEFNRRNRRFGKVAHA